MPCAPYVWLGLFCVSGRHEQLQEELAGPRPKPFGCWGCWKKLGHPGLDFWGLRVGQAGDLSPVGLPLASWAQRACLSGAQDTHLPLKALVLQAWGRGSHWEQNTF